MKRTYKDPMGTEHTEELPDGRYLEAGERIMIGDLYIPLDCPYSETWYAGSIVIDGPFIGHYYRPFPPSKE